MVKGAYNEIMNSDIVKRRMMDDAHLGEIELDTKSNIVGINRGFETLLGYEEGELLQLTFYDLLSEGHETHDYVFPIFKRTGVVRNLTWKMKTKQGQPLTVVLCGRAVYDEAGQFKKAVGIILDITEQVNIFETLQEVEREKALIMDVMTDCIIYYDTDLRVIWANKMVSKISGIPPEELAGKRCFEICHKAQGFCKGCPLGDPLHTTHPKAGEIRANDLIFYIMTYPVKNSSGKTIGIVQIIRNTTEQKMLEREVLEISTKERKKIGNDLHDGLGQMLTGISYMSNALQRNLSGNENTLPIAENIEAYSKRALQMMRDILNGLCPVAEDPDGLMTALETLCSNVSSIYNVKCYYDCCKDIQVPDYEVSNNLYFIAQEAVSNAIKHSKCTRVTIRLKIINDNLLLTIEDDGIGFIEEAGAQTGLGMRSMRYRASIICGTIDISSTQGKGTTIKVFTQVD